MKHVWAVSRDVGALRIALVIGTMARNAESGF